MSTENSTVLPTKRKHLKEEKFKSYISLYRNTNHAINKVFDEFFNILYQDEKVREKYEITNIDLVKRGKLFDSINLTELGMTTVLMDFMGLRLSFKFDVYRSNSYEKVYETTLDSVQQTFIQSSFVYDELFKYAIETSNIKGKYISLFTDVLDWKITEFTNRDFNDIFLPNRIGNELRLYKKVFEVQNHLMRYLFVGIPGTGKTESTIVLQNELNKLGVTIIKTTICNAFKEKIHLAEMLAPSIVILDDIDLVLGSRNAGQISGHLKSFLDVLDGTEKISENVGIIATTNSTKLLDIAAKRPGRFHKVVLFDDLTEDNIKDIIKKSLKANFKITDVKKEFINNETINLYKEKGLTGSHIYNITELLYRKYKILNLNGELTDEWVTAEVKREVEMMELVRNFNGSIEETFDKNKKNKVGFDENSKYEDEDELYMITEEVEDPETELVICEEQHGDEDTRKYESQ